MIFWSLFTTEKVAHYTIIYYFRKHLFSFLCHASEFIYGVISVPQCGPTLPLFSTKSVAGVAR